MYRLIRRLNLRVEVEDNQKLIKNEWIWEIIEVVVERLEIELVERGKGERQGSSVRIKDSELYLLSNFLLFFYFILFWNLKLEVSMISWSHCHKLSHDMTWCHKSVTAP